jgi:hypothetical protein
MWWSDGEADVLTLLQVAAVSTEYNPITPLRNVGIETSFGVMVLEEQLFFTKKKVAGKDRVL